MDENSEFHSLHLPLLVGYVVAVVQVKDNALEVGSGVLVRVGARHLVATARHCIDGPQVRVVRGDQVRLQRTGVSGTTELHVRDKGWHDSLDLGFLEIHDPACAEMGWDQLGTDRIVGGLPQVVGYPETLTIPTKLAGRLTDISLCAGTFETALTAETDDRLTLDYPKLGRRYDPATGTWHDSEFPRTPRGFSGGAVFGVTKKSGLIEQTEYKLLGIQYAWNESQRVVMAVPIKRWKELLTERGLAP